MSLMLRCILPAGRYSENILNNMRMRSKRMRKIHEEDGCVLWEYTPTLFKPLFGNLDPPSFVRRIRFLLEYLSKGSYKVYYLEVNGTIVGYNVLVPGGRRLKCSSSKDMVSGPSYVLPEYRGNGYIVKLLKLGITYCCQDCENVYAWISKSNSASIKAYGKAGFDVNYGELNIVGKMRKLRQVEKGAGSNIIAKYSLHKQDNAKQD